MDPLGTALRAASGGAPRAPAFAPLETALVLGAGGRLGSALLAEALVAGRFAGVQAWVAAPLTSTLRGLSPLPAGRFAAPGPLAADIAFIVFERERFSNGRDDAFVMPRPEDLPALAQRLRAGGVKRLVVVLPHAASMLPQALAAGLATHDEAAVAALGFEHLVLLKPSQDGAAARAGGLLKRFAGWWLAQLRWMVPEREQPLRAAALARQAVRLARALPMAPPGTQVVSQTRLWQMAREAEGAEDGAARAG